MTEGKSDQGNGDAESYVHQFDETYSALDDLLAEINDVDDSIHNEPVVSRELAKAKKAVSTAARHRMIALQTGGGEA